MQNTSEDDEPLALAQFDYTILNVDDETPFQDKEKLVVAIYRTQRYDVRSQSATHSHEHSGGQFLFLAGRAKLDVVATHRSTPWDEGIRIGTNED